MRQSVIHTPVRKLQLPGSVADRQVVQIVCMALTLAVLTLALRIATIW
jgi:hypothetical protein